MAWSADREAQAGETGTRDARELLFGHLVDLHVGACIDSAEKDTRRHQVAQFAGEADARVGFAYGVVGGVPHHPGEADGAEAHVDPRIQHAAIDGRGATGAEGGRN